MIRHISLFFNKLYDMAQILLLIWEKARQDKAERNMLQRSNLVGKEVRNRPTVGHHAEETEGPTFLEKEVHYEKADEAKSEAQPEGRFRLWR